MDLKTPNEYKEHAADLKWEMKFANDLRRFAVGTLGGMAIIIADMAVKGRKPNSSYLALYKLERTHYEKRATECEAATKAYSAFIADNLPILKMHGYSYAGSNEPDWKPDESETYNSTPINW